MPWEAALAMLLGQLDARIEEDNGTVFSLDVQQALKAVRDARFGSVRPGPAIDYGKLHKSDRTKSGFVGVYANGKGFRAMAKDPKTGRQVSIGTFKTAEIAAWERYLFYTKNGMPYGELEIEMERWRNPTDPSTTPFTGTDEELIAAIRAHSQLVGTERQIFGAEDENAPAAKPTMAPASVPAPKQTDVPAGFDPDNLPDDVKALLDAEED